MKKAALVSLACAVCFFGFSQSAFAHARLLSSKPQADSTVRGPAVQIDLRFDSRVDSARSRLALMMPDGKIKSLKIVPSGVSELDARSALPPGKYTIRWQALSTDGHITRGEIPFTVAR